MKTELDSIDCFDKLKNVCRICLCESNADFRPFNPYWKSLYEKVMSCMQIEFLMKDMLPSDICDMCCKELEMADKFRIKCENSNAVLKRVYQQYLVKDEQKQTIENKQGCWEVPLEDNKEQIKDVILQINLEGSVVNDDSKKETTKSKESLITKMENESNIKNSGKSSKTTKKQLFACDVCNKQLKDKKSLAAHITKQHSAKTTKESNFKVVGYGSERMWSCLECPYTSKRKTYMTVHSRTHTGHRPYVCDVCSRSFKQFATLSSHKKTHFDTTYYTCQECGKQFKYRDSLNRHKSVHSNEYNFVCQVCNKRFKLQDTLTNHVKRHSETKNHSCEICGTTFVTKGDLNNHRHTHTNSKRFYCTQCDYSTHWKNHLKIHTRRHRKDKTVECDECDYVCYTNAQLKLHKIKHTKVQMFPCPICNEKFKHKCSISKHVKRKHGPKIGQEKVAEQTIENE